MDVTFHADGGWFIYRVGAILVRDGRALMAHNDRDHYHYSVGGRVHLGESADDALRREVIEELGAPPASQQLVVINENFFPMDQHEGDVHEICLYYVITMPPDWELDNGRESWADGVAGDVPMAEWYEWVPLDRFGEMRVYPTWLPAELAHPWVGIRHIITRE